MYFEIESLEQYFPVSSKDCLPPKILWKTKGSIIRCVKHCNCFLLPFTMLISILKAYKSSSHKQFSELF